MTASTTAQSGRRQRSVKNLLLDKKFQLKYTSYLVAITFLLSSVLGVILWRTSSQVVEQGEHGAAQGQQIVELGAVVLKESRKVSAVVRMSIVNDPIYQDNPELLEAFNGDAKEQDRLLDGQRAKLERQRKALVAQAKVLNRSHRTMLWSLAIVLTLLVLGIGAAGIFVTHKIAGPIFKMKRHLREVTAGQLQVPWGLRKGDELVDFFDAFREMVVSLRAAREQQITRVEDAVTKIEQGDGDAAQKSLRALKADLEKALL